MKVCLIGGYNRVISFANELIKHDVITHVISFNEINGLNKSVIIHPDLFGKLQKKNPFSYFQFLRLLKKKLNSIKPDIVHAFFVPWYGWSAALTGYHPLVISTMGGDVNPLQGAYHNMFRKVLSPYTLKKADLITIVTNDGLSHIKERIGPDINYTQFRTGFNPDLFFKKEKPNYLIQKYNLEQKYVLLSPRGLSNPIYNIETIILGFQKFSNKYPDSNLIILGDIHTDYAIQILNLIDQLEIQNNIILPGRITHQEMNDYLNLSDLVISIPFDDGFPAVLIEAYACGKPVIACENNSISEIFTDRKNGLLIESKNYLQLSKSIEKLMIDKSLYQGISSNNIQYARNHEIDKYAISMIQHYDILVNKTLNH